MRRLSVFIFFTFLFSISACGGSNSGSEGGENGGNESIVPSNLELTYVLQGSGETNPNGDGSGEVHFIVSAENAVRYEVFFGDGDGEEFETPTFSHIYDEVGLRTYTVKVIAYSSTGDSIQGSFDIQVERTISLFWSDEFDSDGAPNDDYWSFEIGDGCPNLCGWGNNEVQYYTDDSKNVEVKDGSLFIRALKESKGGKPYTSTRMISKGKMEFQEGRVEIRAKLPKGGGTWPAFWLLGGDIDQIGWPKCGEIDIMEHVGNDVNHISSALHTPSSYGNTQNVMRKSISNDNDEYYNEFHLYGLNWTKDKMEFSLDGVVYYTYAPNAKNDSTWPFNKDCFLIFNIAVGGNLGGNIDSSWTSSEMEIDYIRIYK